MNEQEKAFVMRKVRERRDCCPACRSLEMEARRFVEGDIHPITAVEVLCRRCGIIHTFDTKTLGITGDDGRLVDDWDEPPKVQGPDKFRVRVVACGEPLAWYADLIGEELEVYRQSSRDYVLAEDRDKKRHDSPWRHIKPADCEVVE